MVSFALLAVLALPQKPLNFYPLAPYDSGIPKPETVLGYQPGEAHTNFRDQERVYAALLQAAPKRTKMFEFGKSWEGRPLRVIAISSEENIKNLETHRQNMAKLATGDPAQAPLKAKVPVFVWVNETVHGNESASFESGMWLAYNLLASKSPKVSDALKDVVVLINPVFNPDGHERFVVWNRSIAVGSDHPLAFETREPRWVHGRTNHYRFDMNRDRVAFSQAETQAEAKELLRWNPQVYIDQHGQTSEYFFPPNSMSVNTNVDRNRIEKWTQIFGRAYAKAFDQQGWLYFVRDTFDFYAPCYLDTFATYSGAIGMTHETDGGRMLKDLKDDGSPLTLELGMAKHMTTALTTVFTAKDQKTALLDQFFQFKTNAASGAHAGKFQRVVVTSEDPRPLKRLQTQLNHAGIKSQLAGEKFSQSDAHDFWTNKVGSEDFPAGSLVVDMAQPMGQFAKALLEPGQRFEEEFTKVLLSEMKKQQEKVNQLDESESLGFYDITGWSVVYSQGLKAWWCESAPAIKSGELAANKADLNDSPLGFFWRYTDQDDILGVARLAMKGYKARVATKPMKVANLDLPKGTFFFFAARNDDDLREALLAEARACKAVVGELPTAFPEGLTVSGPGNYSKAIREPKIGMVFGADDWISAFGHVWYVFDHVFKLPFTPLTASGLNGDLSDFSAILVPSGRYNSVPAKFTDWIRSGGCAIILGDAGWAIGESKLMKLEEAKLEKDADIMSLPGSLFEAQLDDRSMLAFGYGTGVDNKIPFAVAVEGNRYYKAPNEIDSVVTFPAKDNFLLSGWSWPENTEKALKSTGAVFKTGMGNGTVVVFLWDPFDRAMWPIHYKMVLNAMIVCPN